MNKLHRLAAISCLHCLHWLHLFQKTVATLFSQGGNTVATQHDTPYSRLSRLKTLFNSRVGGSSVGTLPDFAQENDVSRGAYLMDEYDRFDYEQWEANHEDEWNDIGWPEWWDAVEDGENRKSWCAEAVDEAIDEEKPGEYPPSAMGDIPF